MLTATCPCLSATTTTTTTGRTGSVHYHLVILSVIGGIIFVILSISVYVSCREKQRDEKCPRQPLDHVARHASDIELNPLVQQSPAAQLNRHNADENHIVPVPSTRSNGSSSHTMPCTGIDIKKQMVKTNIAVTSSDQPRPHSKPEDAATSSHYLHVNTHDDPPRLGLPANNYMPTLVTIETEPPETRRLCVTSRDHSPSPRPDLVCEDKFGHSLHPSVSPRKPNPENQAGPIGDHNRREQPKRVENVAGSPVPQPPYIFYTRPNTQGRNITAKQSVI